MEVVFYGVAWVVIRIVVFIGMMIEYWDRHFPLNQGVENFPRNPGVGYFPPKPGIGFVRFVCAVVVSLLQKLWTNFIRVLNRGNNGMGGGRGTRRRSQPASTADTPRAAGRCVLLYRITDILEAVGFYLHMFTLCTILFRGTGFLYLPNVQQCRIYLCTFLLLKMKLLPCGRY